jgi:hypothetical protein
MIKKNLRPVTEIAFVILLALPLVLYAWIGFYSRYVADDFWSAGYLRTLGFWGAQYYWYTGARHDQLAAGNIPRAMDRCALLAF